MAYSRFRLNITTMGFPLLSELSGRTIVIPQLDENDQTSANTGLVQAEPEKRNPAMYYCHDVLPTSQGFQSVSYVTKLPAFVVTAGTYQALGTLSYTALAPNTYTTLATVATASANLNFDRIFEIRGINEQVTYAAFDLNGGIYIFNTSTQQWVSIIIAGWTGGEVTVATVLLSTGITTFLCLSMFGIYTFDLSLYTLTSVTWGAGSSIVNNTVLGITACYNYLILYNSNSIQWSSAFNPKDFNLANAIISGTGFGTPVGIAGAIVACVATTLGFIVYTTSNAVSANYSGNIQYPWNYVAIANSSGVLNSKKVCQSEDGGNYAWTAAGILKLGTQLAVEGFPEVTDFLASRTIEDYDSITDILTTAHLQIDLKASIRYIGKRYIVISYGQNIYNFALVYDTGLKRWGKLKIDHVDVIDINFNSKQVPANYSQLGTTTFAALAPNNYLQFYYAETTVGTPKRSMGFMSHTGQVSVVNTDLGNLTSNAVLLLGKFQLDRKDACQLDTVLLENIDQACVDFSLQVGVSLNGKDINYPLITPYLSASNNMSRSYNSRLTGQNHTLFLKGAFNLVSALVVLLDNGAR